MGRRGLMLILSSPSGAGKTTLTRMLLQLKESDLTLSISLTTRKRRSSEADGIHYHFIDKAEFERRRDADELLERCRGSRQLLRDRKANRVSRNRWCRAATCCSTSTTRGARQVREIPRDVVTIFILLAVDARIRARGSSDAPRTVRKPSRSGSRTPATTSAVRPITIMCWSMTTLRRTWTISSHRAGRSACACPRVAPAWYFVEARPKENVVVPLCLLVFSTAEPVLPFARKLSLMFAQYLRERLPLPARLSVWNAQTRSGRWARSMPGACKGNDAEATGDQVGAQVGAMVTQAVERRCVAAAEESSEIGR